MFVLFGVSNVNVYDVALLSLEDPTITDVTGNITAHQCCELSGSPGVDNSVLL